MVSPQHIQMTAALIFNLISLSSAGLNTAGTVWIWNYYRSPTGTFYLDYTTTTSTQTIIIRFYRCDLMTMESTITRRLCTADIECGYFFAAELLQDSKYRHHFVSFHLWSILGALSTLFELFIFAKT